MSYLLRLRRWLRIHPNFAIIFGGTVFVSSGVAAIFFRFSFFYSSFVIGLFLFFDAATHLLNRTISFSSSLDRIGRTFWVVLGIFIVVTDLVGGQIVFTIWKYPPYHSALNWILLYLIVYPVGGLSQIAMYRFFELLFAKVLPGNLFRISDPRAVTRKILRVVLFTLPLAVILPLSFYLSGVLGAITASWPLYVSLYFFLFAEWTLFFDVLILAFNGRPILLDFIEGNKKIILAVVISGLLGATLHELINTYVYEWAYIADKFPVTTATLFGVPVMVFVGWIPLTIVCVQAYRFGQIVKDGKLLDELLRTYIQ